MTFRRILARVEAWVISAELTAITLGLLAILVAVSGNALSRTFRLPWPDFTDPALVGMTVIAFIGSAYAVAVSGHITIDLGDIVPMNGGLRRWMERISDLVVVALSVMLIIYGGDFLRYVINLDERTSSMEIPLWLPVGSLWLGSVLSIFHVARRNFFALVPGPVSASVSPVSWEGVVK